MRDTIFNSLNKFKVSKASAILFTGMCVIIVESTK